MSRLMKWATPVVAFAVLMFAAAVVVKAEDKKETGSVSGMVTNADGKAAAGVEVGIYHPMMKKSKSAEGKAEGGAKGDKPVSVVPVVKTDDKGEFTLSDVPVGDYTVRAFLKGEGQARKDVSVKSGETVKVELQLKKGNKSGGAGSTEKPKAEVAK
jgi:Carboxypeptidase regulatory-like domain